jgi:hypothetical protein
VVGTGGAVRPLTLCLSAQGPRWTDPTIAPAFDGLKYFRLSQGKVSRPLPASVVIPWTSQREVQPASQSAGVSAVPHSQGVTGRSSAPSTEMSRMTIYLADLLEGDSVRFI